MAFSQYSLTLTAAAPQNAAQISVTSSAWIWLPSGYQFTMTTPIIIGSVKNASGVLIPSAPTLIPVALLPVSITAGTVANLVIDDNSRIRKHLKLSLNDRLVVDSQMNLVTLQTPGAIPDIQKILAELDFLDSVSASQGSSGNAMLVKAAVLEWLPGGQIQSVSIRKNELRMQLGRYLDLLAWMDDTQPRTSRR